MTRLLLRERAALLGAALCTSAVRAARGVLYDGTCSLYQVTYAEGPSGIRGVPSRLGIRPVTDLSVKERG